MEAPLLHAQQPELPLFVRASYTTSIKVFLNPFSPSISLRNEHTEVNGVVGVAAELQVPLTEDFSLSAAIEVLSHVEEGLRPIVLGGVLRKASIKDGFTLIPVELGGVISIPVGTETVHLTMGGGLGVTVGIPVREIAGVRAVSEGTPVAYSIHVNIGFDYEILTGVGVHVAMRFRDPEVTLTSAYTQPTVTIDGVEYPLPNATTRNRVSADGFNIAAGVRVDLRRIFDAAGSP